MAKRSILLKRAMVAKASPEAWLLDLLRWLREGDAEGGPAGQRTRRLEELAAVLAGHAQGQAWLARIQELWRGEGAVALLAGAGLPGEPSFLAEILGRMSDRFLPQAGDGLDLAGLVRALRLDAADAEWAAGLTPAQRAPWEAWLALPEALVWDAARLVSLRMPGLALGRDRLGVGAGEPVLASPFVALPEAVATLSRGGRADLETLLAACRARLAEAHARMDQHGVSTALVYRLDLLEAHLGRLEALAELARGQLDAWTFAVRLIRLEAEHHSLRGLYRNSLRTLARKVVEHTGHTGEHYVAWTRTEYWATLRSAAGGGLLTVVTAALKFALGAAALAPGLAGLGFAANYTGSFLVMQAAGFTLASKQPAMTASALAGALEADPSLHRVVRLVAGITRSQAMATLGNVATALPAGLLCGFLAQALRGGPVLSAGAVDHAIHGLHPLLSMTLPYAALTGVLLWLSSLAAGWAANWSAYRRLPEGVAASPRLRRWLGEAAAARSAAVLRRHLPGAVGYLALGLLLGFVPVALAFVGLPIEVRHVTLSAASLGIAAAQSLTSAAPDWPGLAWGVAAVALIGALNFTVSFALALGTALDARGLGAGPRSRLARWLFRRFLRRPRWFLGPPGRP